MTERQKQLLAAIIAEFIESAEAVGSVSLNDKYDFDVSPATIRNEMATLMREGYLAKPHSSSGRVPTTLGFRYFIQELLDSMDELDVVTQETLKQRWHQRRFEQRTLVTQAIKFLSELSGNAAIALVDENVYYAGLSEMLNLPEFQEVENLRTLMTVLEDYEVMSGIFDKNKGDRKVRVLIGEETGLESFKRYAVVFADLRLHGGRKGYIAVVGPNRMDYAKVIPAVNFTAKSINQMTGGWS